MSWTDERVEKLKEYWGEGMSASQIAKQLGGVTRNAVIGKVHRLGLSHRGAVEAVAPDTPAEAEAVPAQTEAAAEGATLADAADAPLEQAQDADPIETETALAGADPDPVDDLKDDETGDPSDTSEDEDDDTPAPVSAITLLRDPTQPRPPGAPTPEEEAARTTLAEIEKMARRLDLMELTERTCKWPIGDPTEDGFHFCGLPSVPGKPYCRHHVAIAFQPMSPRRDRVRVSR